MAMSSLNAAGARHVPARRAGPELAGELTQAKKAIATPVPGDLQSAIGRLQAAEFLYEAVMSPDLVYRFKHALTHSVAYGSLLQEQRRALHGRIVEAIERLCQPTDRTAIDSTGYPGGGRSCVGEPACNA
jgi:hypothetical protein